MRPVRIADPGARHRRLGGRLEAAAVEVLRSGRYVGGPEVGRFERALAARCRRAHAVGVASGTDALLLALQALGVRPGDEVVVPAVTFFATAGAVVRAGARPVVADVLEDRPLLDPDAARRLVGPRTRAVVPVWLFGMEPPDASGLGLDVLDDAAQAVGAPPPLGRGRATAVSFYPTKVLGGAGDGGAVLTDDDDLARRVRLLGNHGQVAPQHHEAVDGVVGTNSRLDALQAAMLSVHLDDLDARLARRRAVARRYEAALGDLLVPWGGAVSVLAIRHPRRDALARALEARGIETAIYYPRPLQEQPALAGLLRADQPATPVAARFCAEVLALPCHESLSDEDVDRVIAAVRECA